MLTRDIVPINRFNRGEAASIFETLDEGEKIVVKNNVPVAVCISPKAYDEMKRQLKEASLVLDALHNRNGLTSLRTLIESAGITEEELAQAEDVEIE